MTTALWGHVLDQHHAAVYMFICRETVIKAYRCHKRSDFTPKCALRAGLVFLISCEVVKRLYIPTTKLVVSCSKLYLARDAINPGNNSLWIASFNNAGDHMFNFDVDERDTPFFTYYFTFDWPHISSTKWVCVCIQYRYVVREFFISVIIRSYNFRIKYFFVHMIPY